MIYTSSRVNMISETFILYTFLPYDCLPFLRLVKLFSGCFRQVVFIWETVKVVIGPLRQMVVL